MTEDYKLIVKWMGYPKSCTSKFVIGEYVWNPENDLNCWPAIYENMTETQLYKFEQILYHINYKDLKITWTSFCLTCCAEARYKALIQMLKEKG